MKPEQHPGSRHRPSRTFVSLTGPAGNLGDALIRRGTLDWARDTSEELVAYVGDAPDVWVRQLDVPADATLLRSKRSVLRWLWLLATAPPHPVLIFEAGEVPLHRGNALRESVFLAETLIVRAKRGVVVRPPRGIRAPSEPSRWLHALAARHSQFSLWRDAASAALVGGAAVAPDLGFGAVARSGEAWDEREEIIVSLRGARPHPDEAWVAAVRELSWTSGLRIRTVVQVREDEARAKELASALGGTFEPWGDRDPLEQEAFLRVRYEGAKLVISDRLHVLVIAALSGAVPVELIPHPTRKITEAFATIGFRGISLDSSAHPPTHLTEFLAAQLSRADELSTLVADAADSLAELERTIRSTIRAVRA